MMDGLLKCYLLRIFSISTNWFSVYAISEDDAIDIIVKAIEQHRTGSADYSPRDLWEVKQISFIGPGWYRIGDKVILGELPTPLPQNEER